MHVLGAALVLAGTAHAQLASVTSTNTGSTCPNANSTTRFCGNSVAFSTPSNGTTFTSRYASNVNADGTSGTTTNNGNSQHNVSFTATAPGGYRVDITTSRFGSLDRVADTGGGNGSVDTTAVTGASNIALSSGSVTLTDGGGIGTGSFTTTSPIAQIQTATIYRVSNGAAQSHTLTYTWSQTMTSNAAGVAVRLGQANGTTTGCVACDYPGTPARTLANDGQFVTVTYTSLCGNGVIDAQVSEQCDEGANNGTANSCCNANCTLKTAGTLCRAAAGVCDVTDLCNGSSGACPDVLEPSSTVCRPGSGDLCDPTENCTGSGVNCPADVVQPATTVCNPGTGDLCDPSEFCTGNPTEACPADNVTAGGTLCRAGSGDACDPDELCTGNADEPCPANTIAAQGTVCNPGSGDICDPDEVCSGNAGDPCPVDSPGGAFGIVCNPGSGDLCDPDEHCTGVADAPCPADSVMGAFTICRPVAGDCDVADSCPGVADVPCPVDSVMGAFTVCRGSAGICDAVENCDGLTANCPADGFQPTSTSCRAPAGVCDHEEFCPGTGVTCPGDTKLTSVCRASAGVCDIAESCSGSSDTCPADAVKPASVVCRGTTDACDTVEYCDGSTVACPAEVTLDGDNDGIGDGCDGCNNIGPVYAVKPTIKVRHLATAPGDDTFQFKGTMTMPATPTIDPLAKGARITIQTSVGTVILDAIIPGGAPYLGAGWVVNSPKTVYLYRNRGTGVPTVEGVTKFKISLFKNAPGKVKFNVKGKRDNYVLPIAELPLHGTLVIDSPVAVTGQCGQALFDGTLQNPGSCALNGAGSTVKCR